MKQRYGVYALQLQNWKENKEQEKNDVNNNQSVPR